MAGMLHRHLTEALTVAAKTYPVVTLIGPRQSGKTTLVRALFPDHLYLSLEAPDLRARAIDDPRSLLTRGDRLILDEIQRVPELLSYIQVLVDDDGHAGRFILTGSQNLLLMESVSQTLAGRTAFLRLYPLSLSELWEGPPPDPLNLDRTGRAPAGGAGRRDGLAGAVARPHRAPDSGRRPRRGLWETLLDGFYPRIHDRGLPAGEWLGDYLHAYVERDLREVMQISDLRTFERFVRLAAAHTARELNLTTFAADVGITQQTAKRWLTALEIGFLATTLPPHHANYRKRLRKRPRLHFLDTGLVCHLLDIRDAGTLERHPLRGAVFESFVVSELIKSFTAMRRDPPLYCWRDATGREIDILIDTGERVIPVEVKSGRTVPADAVDTLAWWTSIPSNPNQGGVLVHGGAESFDFKGFRVLPWFLT